MNAVDNIIYSVDIYPWGLTSRRARVCFESADHKKEYLKEEITHTREEWQRYAQALTVDDRKYHRKNLEAKRVLFARYKGFLPSEGDKTIWEQKVTIRG